MGARIASRLARMLTREAQPTSTARHTRRALSAAGCVLMALAAILLPLAPPESASAEGPAAAASGSGAWPWPLLGEVITPYRNGSDPYAAGQHRGLDIAAPAGSPVLAIVGGRVSFSGRLPDGGETVTIVSSDGSWLVSSLHLSRRSVTRGDPVSAGTALGEVGLTGKRSASRPHLHLSVRRAGSRAYVDPLTLLGSQRLPESPTVSGSVPGVRAQAERVSVSPLKTAPRESRNVHAQSAGDISPARRHGAKAETTPSRSAAGAPAREGHAADKATSRVAPPPLKTGSRPAAEPARVVATPTATAASSPGSTLSPSRWLLAAIAAVCLVALIMRRRPRSRSVAPTGAAPESSAGEPAEVIAIANRRRSA